MRLDHVVILVPDLARAAQDYIARGFTVTPGGEHTHGNTHNALVCFADGAYLELLAFKTPERTEHRWDRYRDFPGVIDYCLGYDSVESAVNVVNARGLSYRYAGESGRVRPDGMQLRWRSGAPSNQNRGLPFMIDDMTPREWRVPSGAARQHANGAIGIAQLEVWVSDLTQARTDFTVLVGAAGREENGTLLFDVNGVALRVVEPASDTPEAQRLNARGAGPWQVLLRKGDHTIFDVARST
jgi:catechol 2,3-dioxygenase-like lactoylglutathione lyase family enzyme